MDNQISKYIYIHRKNKNKHFFLYKIKSLLGSLKTLPLYIDFHENSIYFLLLSLDLHHSAELLYSRPDIIPNNFKLFLNLYTNIDAFVSFFKHNKSYICYFVFYLDFTFTLNYKHRSKMGGVFIFQPAVSTSLYFTHKLSRSFKLYTFLGSQKTL